MLNAAWNEAISGRPVGPASTSTPCAFSPTASRPPAMPNASTATSHRRQRARRPEEHRQDCDRRPVAAGLLSRAAAELVRQAARPGGITATRAGRPHQQRGLRAARRSGAVPPSRPGSRANPHALGQPEEHESRPGRPPLGARRSGLDPPSRATVDVRCRAGLCQKGSDMRTILTRSRSVTLRNGLISSCDKRRGPGDPPAADGSPG